MLFKQLLWVGVGGFFGSSLRFLVGKGVTWLTGSSLPLGTFAANILGCLIFGFIAQHAHIEGRLSSSMQLLLITGFCGGFTTFSTFVNENSLLMHGNKFFHMGIYMVASLIVGLFAIYCGEVLARWSERLL